MAGSHAVGDMLCELKLELLEHDIFYGEDCATSIWLGRRQIAMMRDLLGDVGRCTWELVELLGRPVVSVDMDDCVAVVSVECLPGVTGSVEIL